jgi:16S rRNA (cytidine1402-2'-O)-methyltransferase
MVPRAVEVLQTADLIAAEDTRHSAPLLKHFDVRTPMVAYHDHSDGAALQRIARCIEGGGAVALISDAGTPLISDPGYRLLQYAHEQAWRVVPVPGASAVIAALSVAGLATDRFRFEGFLPARQAARCARLKALSAEAVTLVFYEAPHRLVETLSDMRECFGDERLAVLARELTKAFETIIRAPLAELEQIVGADANQSRGEIVLLVEAATPAQASIDAQVKVYGLRKKTLYELLVSR